MVKVFAAVKGAEVRVEGYGVATYSDPVLVPGDVAKELIKLPSLCGERETKPANPETKAPAAGTAAPKTETKPSKGEKE